MSLELQLREGLTAGLTQLSLHVAEPQQQQLVQLVLDLHKWNQAYNLTSVRDPLEMLNKHIFDSLAVAPLLDGQRFIDVGTGPGLPGLPLAIVQPEREFVLLDSLGKRIRFIKQIQFAYGLKNVTAVQARVQDYPPDPAFDGVISRAFASLKDMLHWCAHLVDSQGAFFALKGQYPSEELHDLPTGFALAAAHQLRVPGLVGERHLLKITTTNG